MLNQVSAFSQLVQGRPYRFLTDMEQVGNRLHLHVARLMEVKSGPLEVHVDLPGDLLNGRIFRKGIEGGETHAAFLTAIAFLIVLKVASANNVAGVQRKTSQP